MAARRVLLFPGQGSQVVGMGKDLCNKFPVARHVFEEVDEALKEHLSKLMFDGDQATLTRTCNAQPALLAHSIAVVAVLKSELGVGIGVDSFSLAMGHSLGEFSALVATNSLTLSQTAKLVRLRGEAMQRCAETTWLADDGTAMMALLPVSADDAAEACRLGAAATGGVCEVANVNSPKQVVISGTRKAVEAAAAEAKARFRVRRAVGLPVSAPFHCSLMEPVSRLLGQILLPDLSHAPGGHHQQQPDPRLEGLEWTGGGVCVDAPSIPLVANVSATEEVDPGRIRELLVAQASSTVHWHPSMQYCLQALRGDESTPIEFWELGCGQVLTGLVKQQQSPRAVSRSLGTEADVVAFLKDQQGSLLV